MIILFLENELFYFAWFGARGCMCFDTPFNMQYIYFGSLLYLLEICIFVHSFSFISVGDWGCGKSDFSGYITQCEVSRVMASIADTEKVNFVVGLGDNFYEHGVNSVDDEQFRDTFEDVYPQSSLQVPWYHILGNHDYEGSIDAQIKYSKHSLRWNMPNRYYAESLKLNLKTKLTMLFIDTNSFSSSDTEQLIWIEETLALESSTSNYLLVFGHHPVYSGGKHGNTVNLQILLEPLLEKYKAVYISGHDHTLQHLYKNDINYIISGNGCKSNGHYFPVAESQFGTLRKGFVLHTFLNDMSELRNDFIDIRETSVYSVTIKARF